MIAVCAILSASLHIFIAAFQVLLAAGMPWGKYAFGGQNVGVLSLRLRIASIFSSLILLAFALVNLQQAGVVVVSANPLTWEIGSWVVTCYAVLGTLMNAISRSRPERFLWTPIAALLAGLNISILVLGAK